MSYRSLSPFYDMLFGRIPERPLQPPEPSQEELMRQEAEEFMAGEAFDDMTKEAIEFTLDCPDLIEPILKAAVTRNLWGDESRLLQEALAQAIAKAREAFIEARLRGRA